MSGLEICRVYIAQSMHRKKSEFAHQRNYSFFLLNKAGEIRRRYLMSLKTKDEVLKPHNLELF